MSEVPHDANFERASRARGWCETPRAFIPRWFLGSIGSARFTFHVDRASGMVTPMGLPSRELSPEDRELIDFAASIIEANGDGDIHTVGAAVRSLEGAMYGGINLHHFTGGPCAELSALAHARASGARELTTIVAVGDERRGPLSPCGRDRQVLFDYYPTIRVLVPTEIGVRSIEITELLPLGFRRIE